MKEGGFLTVCIRTILCFVPFLFPSLGSVAGVHRVVLQPTGGADVV